LSGIRSVSTDEILALLSKTCAILTVTKLVSGLKLQIFSCMLKMNWFSLGSCQFEMSLDEYHYGMWFLFNCGSFIGLVGTLFLGLSQLLI